MTSAADTFAAFVDVLADSLDDHEASGADSLPASTSRASTRTG